MSLPELWILGATARRAPSVRAQTAVVRALADAFERQVASGDVDDSLRQQLVEELARLGLRPSRTVTEPR